MAARDSEYDTRTGVDPEETQPQSTRRKKSPDRAGKNFSMFRSIIKKIPLKKIAERGVKLTENTEKFL